MRGAHNELTRRLIVIGPWLIIHRDDKTVQLSTLSKSRERY